MTLLWGLCLAIALIVLAPTSAHAHGGAHATADQLVIDTGPENDGNDTIGHCHSGASCGVGAIIGLTSVSFSNVATADGFAIFRSDLANLISYSFDPPPPRNLS